MLADVIDGFIQTPPLVLAPGRRVQIERPSGVYRGVVVAVQPIMMRVEVAPAWHVAALGQTWLIDWPEVTGYRPEMALPVVQYPRGA